MALSDILKRAKVATSLSREADRLYYERVAEEMRLGIRDEGVWLMAFEKAEGDQTRAKAFYIGLRVERIKELDALQNNFDTGRTNPLNECPYCRANISESTVVCASCNRVLKS